MIQDLTILGEDAADARFDEAELNGLNSTLILRCQL